MKDRPFGWFALGMSSYAARHRRCPGRLAARPVCGSTTGLPARSAPRRASHGRCELRAARAASLGRPVAKEFAAVTGTASIGALVLALMFGSTGQASPGAGAALPPAATAANAPASSTASTTPTTSSPTTSATPSLTPTAAVEMSTAVTEVVLLPFARQTVNDGALEQGKTVLRTAGRAGSKTVTWTVRNRGGVEISRTISGEQVTAAPVERGHRSWHQGTGSAPGAKDHTNRGSEADSDAHGHQACNQRRLRPELRRRLRPDCQRRGLRGGQRQRSCLRPRASTSRRHGHLQAGC